MNQLFKYNISILSMIIMLSVVFSCSNEKINTASVIKGTVEGFAGQKATIKNMNPYIFNIDTVDFDANGVFVYNLAIEHPQYLLLSIGRTDVMLYVRPGDSTIFTGDGKDLLNTTRFSGDAPIYNDYVIRSNKISADFQKNMMDYFGQNEQEAMSNVDALRAMHADEMASLQTGNSNLDPYFLKIEKARMLYEWALMHSIYPEYYNYINKGEQIVISPEYTTYLAQVDLDDQSLIELPMYVSFLETYMRKEYNAYYIDSLQKDYPSYLNYQLQIISKTFTNDSIKSLISYNAVKEQITYDGIKDYDEYWTEFTQICKQEVLLNNLTEMLSEWSHLKRGEPAKGFTFVNNESKEISLSDFQGKWVYIDIWATWCNPCRAEIPYLKALEEEFRGRNIEFMSISVDKTKEPWIRMVAEEDLKGVQLWAGQNEIIKDFYKVNGIPRFMIIDPQGNIYQSSADRPSMGVGEELDKLLNE